MCTVQGCLTGGYHRKGLCPKHYYRMKRHGSFDPPRTPPGEPMSFLMSSIGHSGTDCLTWPYGVDKWGYAKIYNDGHMGNAHRLMCRLAHGEPSDPKLQATHTCGKGHEGCVNPNHLEWGTNSKNQLDRVGHGTDIRGQNHPNNKLSPAQVLEIYSRRDSGRTAKSVAPEYNVARETVRDIWSGKKWTWLTQSP